VSSPGSAAGGGILLRVSLFASEIRSRTFLWGIFLAVATVAVYYPARSHPFCNLDDYFYLVDNAHLHSGWDWATIWWSFRAFNYANWIPLTWLSYALEYPFFGSNPAGYHTVNILLHALDVVLLFWVLKRATGRGGRSFMVAALFALHPMNVEPVVWIAERKTVLSMVFFLLALEAYRWYARAPGLRRYVLVLLFCGMAMAAKPQVITLPFLLLLWDYWPLQRMLPSSRSSLEAASTLYPPRSFSSLIKEKLPLLFLSAVDAVLTLYTQKSVRLGLMPPFSLRFKNAVFSYWLYIKKAFWPSGMAPEYPQLGRDVSWWQVFGVLFLLIAITALVVWFRRKRYLPVGWLWFVGALVPMIGLLQAAQQGMADRFVYQAYLGLFFIVCWGTADWAEQHAISVRRLASVSAVVLLALTMVTHRQIGYWKDKFTLWSHATQVVNHHWIAEDNLGVYLMEQGKPADALTHFFRASAINPDDGVSNRFIGFYEQTLGNQQEAIVRYSRALRDYTLIGDDRAQVWRNLAVAYRDVGDMEKSREYYEKWAKSQQK
jgi:protein O-mannosyl-transferase